MSCAIERGNFPVWRRVYGPRLDLRRLTPEQVARIRAAPYRGIPALAREFGITPFAARKIQQRLTYRDLP